MPRLLLFLALTLPLWAQLDSELLLDRIATLEAQPDGTAGKEALPLWKEALSYQKRAAQARTLTATQREQIENPASKPLPELPEALPPKASLEEKTTRLTRLNTLLEVTNNRLEQLEDMSSQSSVRSAKLGEMIATEKEELSRLRLPLNGTDEASQARREIALQRQDYLRASLTQQQTEQSLLTAEADLIPERIRKLTDLLEQLEGEKDALKREVESLRKAQTLSEREAFQNLLDRYRHLPALAPFIRDFEEILALPSQDLLSVAQSYRQEIETLRKRISSQADTARRRISFLESAGLKIDAETGFLLRAQRNQLPSTRSLSTKLTENLERTAQAQITLLNLQDAITRAPVLPPDFHEKHPEMPEAEIEELLSQRSRLLASVTKQYRRLNKTLIEATSIAELTIREIDTYTTFLDERLLWIKSTTRLTATEPLEELQRIKGLFLKSDPLTLFSHIPERLTSHLLQNLILLGFFLTPLLRRKHLSALAVQQSQLAARRNCTSIRPTLITLGCRLLLAFALPALVYLLVNFIEDPALQSASNRAALFLFLGLLLYQLTIPKGFFEAHLRIPEKNTQVLHRNLRWFVPLALLFIFLVGALTWNDSDPPAGRFTFMIGMIPLTWFHHRIFHPHRSILRARDQDATFTHKATYILSLLIPLGFAVVAGGGYFTSVLTLRTKIAATIGLLILAFLIIRVLTRWVLVSRRKLAITQALKRREALLAERSQGGKPGDDKSGDLASLEEVKAAAVDVVEVEEQTTRLLRITTYLAFFFAIWGVWSNALPALTVLDQVHLWGPEPEKPASTGDFSGSDSTSPSLPTPTGSESERTPTTSPLPIALKDDGSISLQDLLLSILFFALTFSAAKNIPGLLSLAVFSRLDLGQGGNFALTTTARYLIVVIGLVLALGTIGITWGKVQFLAAAITLGIGFGLQEIFANFVAGIILLYERPIRLGDVITINDISGSVTQIKIRATTILQFNKRELVVPNKDFITGQLVNWTLKDTIQRVDVFVGAAYGTDSRKVEKILREIAESHEDVLSDPGVQVLFNSFGDSTLDFELRACVSGLETMLPVKTDLHHLIAERFAEEGIEIAFPQRDLHLRSLPENFSPSSASPS